jgi:hypothetical protein
MELTTLFATAPTAESDGRCLYFITDEVEAFVPNNIVNVWVTRPFNHCTVTYNDAMIDAQEKLLLQFCTSSGEYWTIRTGLLS